jgi:hypothetical protein
MLSVTEFHNNASKNHLAQSSASVDSSLSPAGILVYRFSPLLDHMDSPILLSTQYSKA